MKIHYFALPLLASALLAGCEQRQQEAPSAPEVVIADTVAAEPQEVKPVELVPVIRDIKHPSPSTSTSTQSAAKAKKNEKAETIYVEADGAQGRVWGHVTMRGDRGTGTIHDWDENTLAVTVTRHGNELFAVDQNSRQYVFKLKQNKTQE